MKLAIATITLAAVAALSGCATAQGPSQQPQVHRDHHEILYIPANGQATYHMPAQ